MALRRRGGAFPEGSIVPAVEAPPDEWEDFANHAIARLRGPPVATREWTNERIQQLAVDLLDSVVAPDFVPWDTLSKKQLVRLHQFVRYEMEIRRDRAIARSKGQRRAFKLLRSLLSTDQNRQLSQGRYFYATGSEAGIYRFWPARGLTERCVLHGKNHFSVEDFCLHDEPRAIPPADVSTAHLLMVRSDEAGFLCAANRYPKRDRDLWDGEYLRRIYWAKRCREWGIDSRDLHIADMEQLARWAVTLGETELALREHELADLRAELVHRREERDALLSVGLEGWEVDEIDRLVAEAEHGETFEELTFEAIQVEAIQDGAP